ncbi:hypothetical protein FHX37_4625 [Haloactinospora alba]|uniref:Tail protein n=1 Tax=Haloactinospora alba TaxID=405555 RepID=A0A543N2N0_9ACTN|nr:phage tail protein [Haloactinospora alba]TQN26087.1 hypothetical protein FHX37_4625 [Haloactinospora alba]
MNVRIEWNGLTLGGDPYRVTELDGWDDLPGIDAGEVDRPSRHGAWPGRPLAQSRTVTATGLIRAPRSDIGPMVRKLRAATAIAEDAELSPLTVTMLGEALTAHARVSQRTISHGKRSPLGHVSYTLQWTCPDPLRYVPTPTEVIIPPGANRTAPQQGDTPTRPRIRIHGPCDIPELTCAGRRLAFVVVLGSGEWLDIDCHEGTAYRDNGADALSTLADGSVPPQAWTVPPGYNPVAFTATNPDGPARAVVSYHHAHM